ncbi:aldolase [Paenibacillus sp. MWE-103]|uniref:Aldolase n=1 Tax=Paenibacillus artemisiicola TaxID=1172618 RepID=A0ABS3WHL1_9BACL|nr:aldolase [Paenibacillus artemisiicola]MBO7747788.1 aldolase [Paenibacillus artemisiicola]
MRTTALQTRYTVFSLRLESEFKIPELMQAADWEEETDVEIRFGELTEAWEECSIEGEYMAFEGAHVFLRVPDTAIYRISEGSQITVSPFPGADEQNIRLYLLGTCMGTLLMQRRILPLHGSAVVIDGKAYAIVGESGAGKSTLAAAFSNLGYQLLTDDVIAVSMNRHDQVPIVYPAYPQQKLWQESITQLGMDSSRYSPLYETKFAIPIPSLFCTTPVPLAGIFELEKTNGHEVGIRRYDGLERLFILRKHTYREYLITQLEGDQWHFNTISGLAGQVQMYQIRRPIDGFSVYDLVNEILNAVDEANVS